MYLYAVRTVCVCETVPVLLLRAGATAHTLGPGPVSNESFIDRLETSLPDSRANQRTITFCATAVAQRGCFSARCGPDQTGIRNATRYGRSSAPSVRRRRWCQVDPPYLPLHYQSGTVAVSKRYVCTTVASQLPDSGPFQRKTPADGPRALKQILHPVRRVGRSPTQGLISSCSTSGTRPGAGCARSGSTLPTSARCSPRSGRG